jgi:8-oxo-dGTP diphosphatase
MSETPKVGTSVILINSKNEILIGKRMGSHGAGVYSIPGGHVDKFELITDACYRELTEETGILKSDLPFLTFVDKSEDMFKDINKHYITFYYYSIVDDNIKVVNTEPEKCAGWSWVHYSELPENMFCDSYAIIQKLMKGLINV